MHATRGQVYMLNGSRNLTSISPEKKFASGFYVLSVTAHRQALVSKNQNHIAKNSSMEESLHKNNP